MKKFTCLVILFFSISNLFSQNFDCHKIIAKCKPSFVMKSFTPTDKQISITKQIIEDIKKCIAHTESDESVNLSKLHLSLANYKYLIDSSNQTEIIENLSRSFHLDTIGFCETYVSVQAKYGPKFINAFNKYFLDLMTDQESSDIKNYCLSHFEIPKKIVTQDKYSNPIYRNALDSISILDQTYRGGRSNNLPEEQDILDEKNRLFLDSLYEQFGFPTNKQVGKGISTVYHVLLHSKDCDWNKKWAELFIQNSNKTGLNKSKLAWFFDRFFNPSEGYCNQEKEGRRFIAFLLKKYSKNAAKKAGYLDFYPELTNPFNVCKTQYDIFHSLRIFTKKYKVNHNSIQKHLDCLLKETDGQQLPESVAGHIYNEIAQDFSLLGKKDLAKQYIDKLAESDFDLLEVLFKKYYQTPTKESTYRPYYLNDFRKYIEAKYGISIE